MFALKRVNASSAPKRIGLHRGHATSTRRDGTQMLNLQRQSVRAARCARERRSVQATVDALQGRWGDNVGTDIKVTGRAASFSDNEAELCTIEVTSKRTSLRGAVLKDMSAGPSWLHTNGEERRWAPRTPKGAADTKWVDAFHQYKTHRLGVRDEMHEALAHNDLELFVQARKKWEQDQTYPTLQNCTFADRLARGRCLVPGVCVEHKSTGQVGVILACSPWCSAPAMWRAQRQISSLEKGEEQPFYHCALDQRSRPRRSIEFIAEENLVVAETAYPLQMIIPESLLIPCSTIGGYLPGSKLRESLRRQLSGGFFT